MLSWDEALNFPSKTLKEEEMIPTRVLHFPTFSPSPILSACSQPPLMEEMIHVAHLPSLYYRPIMAPISPQDLETLRAMRVASGWYYERIPSWINEIATGQRLMWFIYLSDPMPQAFAAAESNQFQTASYGFLSQSASSSPHGNSAGLYYNSASTSSNSSGSSAAALVSGTAPMYPAPSSPTNYATPGAVYPPVGMVCLSLNNLQDPSLASFSQTGRAEICSLFVYAAYRPLGVGVAAMQNMEERARNLGAIAVTLNTPAADRLLRRYAAMGYREYKARSRGYSSNDVRDAGLPEEYEIAAFLEKSLL